MRTLRLWPPEIVERSVKEVSECMRTILSEEQVARRGRVGCGAVSQAREGDGEVRVDKRVILGGEDVDGIVGRNCNYSTARVREAQTIVPLPGIVPSCDIFRHCDATITSCCM